MDQTKRPLRIPPEFAIYAEKHGIFEMYKRLMQQLIINKPADPLAFLVEQLKRDYDDVPQILILGPPASGKRSISRMVAAKLRIPHLNRQNLVEGAELALRTEAQGYQKQNKPIPSELWVRLIEARVKMYDASKKGWVLEGLPETREQALALQVKGICPKHVVFLEAEDTVLIERAAGKRVDPTTGDVYHTTFDWPSSREVEQRLQPVEGYSEQELVEQLIVYHRHLEGVNSCYESVFKMVNADQPKADVFSQVLTFLSSQPRSAAPHNPRIVLLGPTGSGKGVQAALIANKYNIVNISCGQLIKQAIADETKLGQACKPYVEKDMIVPDAIVLSILKERLSQLDSVSRGWVLHGYPKTREQAEQLAGAGFMANRAFFLDVPNDSVFERLTLRATDPVTGDRYHMLYNPPRSQEVKDRLQVHPKDTEEEVTKRLSQYSVYAEELADYYEQGQHINADQDPHTVFECIESMVVNPLPTMY